MALNSVASDDFESYTDDNFPASNWEDCDNFSGQLRCFGVSPNKRITNAYSLADSTMRRSAGTYSADQYSWIVITGLSGVGTNDIIGACVRNSGETGNAQDYYAVRCKEVGTSTVDIDLVRFVNNTAEVKATQSGLSGVANGDVLLITVSGTGGTVTLNAWLNGSQSLLPNLVNVTDTDNAGGTDQRIIAAGRPGVYGNGAGTLGAASWDGGDYTITSTVTSSGTPASQASTLAGTAERIVKATGAISAQVSIVAGTAVRQLKILLTASNGAGYELRDEDNTPLELTGITFEWYDSLVNTTGSPVYTGTFDTDASGEATVQIPGSVLIAGQFGTLIMRHASISNPVSAAVPVS